VFLVRYGVLSFIVATEQASMAQLEKFLENVPAFDERGNYQCTVLVWQDAAKERFFAVVQDPRCNLVGKTPADFDGERVILADLFPVFVPGLDAIKRVDEALIIAEDYYVKRHIMAPCLVEHSPVANQTFKDTVAIEVEVCHKLMHLEIPNIAKFRGCVVHEGLIVALCFDKYAETLTQRVMRSASSLNKAKVMDRLRTAVSKLHDLGYCHNDINPANIMFASLSDDNPVLIDFDSAQRMGHDLLKVGTPGWCVEELRTSSQENDEIALRNLDEYLTSCGCR